MKKLPVLMLLPLTISLVGCGGSATSSSPAANASTPPAVQTAAPAETSGAVATASADASSASSATTQAAAATAGAAMAVAEEIKAKVGSVSQVLQITEANDPNNAIGRPNSYTDAVSLYDKRVKCETALDVDCGAKVEVFANDAQAETRAKYIQSVRTGGMGNEWTYQKGNVVFRVSGELKPSQAKEYESAFGGKLITNS